MAQEINEFKLTGTIYSIDVTTRTNKKDPSVTYNIHTLIIENNRSGEKSYKNKDGDTKSTYTKKNELVKVEFFNNSLMDTFAVTDFVEIVGYLGGQEWTAPDGKVKIISRNSGTYIKHADLDSGHANHKGKIKVDAMSSEEDLKTAEVFKGANPMITPLDDEEMGDLPF